MKRLPILVFLIFTLGLQGAAQARLTIEITGGAEGAQPIAVVPFGQPAGAGLVEDVAAVITADLARTGRFKPMPRRDMLATPHTADQVDLRDWRLLSMDNLVVGEVTPDGTGGYDVSFVLFDVFRGEQLAAMKFGSRPAELRYTAHRIADVIYERLTGSPGVFSTRLAYVTSEGGGRVTLRDRMPMVTIPRPSSLPRTPSSPRPGRRTGAGSPTSPSRTGRRRSSSRTSLPEIANGSPPTRGSTARPPFPPTAAGSP